MEVLTVEDRFRRLHATCEEILAESFENGGAIKIGKSVAFSQDLTCWATTLKDTGEDYLLDTAVREYQFAQLALVQGHYRQAFKSLRLVLELSLQAVLLSSDRVRLKEWLSSRADTVWAAIIDLDNGVFSQRFAKAFFPEIADHCRHYHSLACALYRECSECVHGNVPLHINIPERLEFRRELLDLWHDKAETLSRVILFALTLRYVKDFNISLREALEHSITERLGHISEIRSIFTG